MQIIPDSAAHKARSDPAIGQLELLYQLKNMHALAICCNNRLQSGEQRAAHSVHRFPGKRRRISGLGEANCHLESTSRLARLPSLVQ